MLNLLVLFCIALEPDPNSIPLNHTCKLSQLVLRINNTIFWSLSIHQDSWLKQLTIRRNRTFVIVENCRYCVARVLMGKTEVCEYRLFENFVWLNARIGPVRIWKSYSVVLILFVVHLINNMQCCKLSFYYI